MLNVHETMRSKRRRITGHALLAAVYVFSSLLAEAHHVHAVAGGIVAVTSHDCGTREVHRPLASSDFCGLCSRLLLSDSLLPGDGEVPANLPFLTVDFQEVSSRSLGVTSSPSDRAPPAVS